jgi:Ca2+-binding RTX toxin-like protein
MSSYFNNWRRFKQLLTPGRSGRRQRTHRRMAAQRLEDRRVLSVTPPTLEGSTLVISGGAEADTVTVAEAPLGLIVVSHVELGRLYTATFEKSSVSLIAFSGQGGDDRFTNLTSISAHADGGEGDDYLIGGSVADTLIGGAGNDRLEGGDGNDTLVGGAGVDLLYGQAGEDYLDGGGDDDKLFGGDDADTIIGGSDDDFIEGGAGNDQIFGGLGNDFIRGNEGDDTLRGEAGDDRLEGGDGNDTLVGGDGVDLLYGQAGEDYLDGGDDADKLYGGDDADTIIGGSGDDFIEGGAGNDQIFGGLGNDFIRGNEGDDTLRGEAGDDRLEGGDGNDTLLGGDGVDLLYGQAGEDYLDGGDDDDTLYGGDGVDRLYGREGDDLMEGGAGDDDLIGGLGNDLLRGDAGNDNLRGEDGNDRLEGGDGNDTLLGGDGADLLYGQTGADYLDGGAHNDTIYGGDDNDTILGGDGDDFIEGGAGDDQITGGNGNDFLRGNDGVDYLLGEAGDDRLEGGDGDDTLLGGDGADLLYGQAGEDYLDGGGDDDKLYGGDDADTIIGGSGDDFIEGGAGNDQIAGGFGNDILYGNDGDDVIYGGDGDDYIDGGNGDDILRGGLDKDFLRGGLGDDILFGEAGDDRLEGDAGADILLGGDGNDIAIGGEGRDFVIGGGGADQLYGSGGEDLVIDGSTAYDDDLTALQAALAIWNSGLSYELRTAALADHHGSVYFIAHDTVFADNVSDQLEGGADRDWFVLSAFNGVYNPLGIEMEHDHHDEGSHHHSEILLDSLPEVEGFALIDSMDRLSAVETNEIVDSLMSHGDDPSKLREHLSMYQLVRYADVTHTAIASGAWTNPAIWAGGQVPTAGARVLIPIGAHVTVNGRITPELQTVRVDGTLSFSTTANSELRVDTVIVTATGAFEMGTAAAPVQPNVTAKLVITGNGPIDTQADPFLLGRGLITHGSVEMYGAAVTSFVAASGSLVAGTTTFQLAAAPVGWKVGDTITIAGTAVGGGQDEVRVIRAISGRQISIDALAYLHTPLEAGLEVHVANLTRNVVIESESNINSQRGHTMFMHNPDVHISYAAFNGLGRTDKSFVLTDPQVDSNWNLVEGTGANPRARYAVHFHRSGSTYAAEAATVVGSVVNGGPGWGFVNHSSYVNFTGNVAYGVNGAAYVAEAGDEIGSFNGNIALHTTGTTEDVDARVYRQDFGFNGDGFWLHSPAVTVTNNIVSGSTGSAFFYYSRGLRFGSSEIQFLAENLDDPALAGGNAKLPVMSVPIKLFEGNVGYSSNTGLTVRYNLRNSLHGARSLISDSTFWNNTLGVALPYANRTTLRDLTVIVDPAANGGYGVEINGDTQNIYYESLRVEGYKVALHLPVIGNNVVDGGRYVSKIANVVINPANQAGMQVLIRGDIDFGSVAGSFAKEVSMVFLTDNASANPLLVFSRMAVTLQYGQYTNHRLYFPVQQASAVPFPIAIAGVPAQYIGLTQQELLDRYGLAIAGEISPADAFTHTTLTGWISATGRQSYRAPQRIAPPAASVV